MPLPPHKRIGFLATGSELISGEILNTNGQKMAQQLLNHGMTIGEHLIVDDQPENILPGLQYLMQRHDCIITCGGLGPTSDDITRNLVADALGKKLIFEPDSFERMVARMRRYNIEIPDSNKRQSYFPEGAVIFPNLQGTADGALIQTESHAIIMLPGPPRECLPLFENQALTFLIQEGFASSQRLYRWRLIGASESAIAEQLESQCQHFDIEFSYRAAYPYLDIKLTLTESDPIDKISDSIFEIVEPYLVTTENHNASTLLKHFMDQNTLKLVICDLATRGEFASEILTESNQDRIQFVKHLPASGTTPYILITGLEQYWNPEPNQLETKVQLALTSKNQTEHFEQTIYLRGAESLSFAVEFASLKILRHFS